MIDAMIVIGVPVGFLIGWAIAEWLDSRPLWRMRARREYRRWKRERRDT